MERLGVTSRTIAFLLSFGYPDGFVAAARYARRGTVLQKTGADLNDALCGDVTLLRER